jgi:polyphosphate kinase 2 (PPK2 family)
MGLAAHDVDKARKHEKRAIERIVQLEQMLVKDSVHVIKIHLHTDKKTQRRRLAELLASKLTRWRVTDEDRWMAKHYDEVSRSTERCLKATDHPAVPWHVVDGTDEEYRLLAVGTILRDGMRDALRAAEKKPASKQQRHAKIVALQVRQPAEALDDEEYHRELDILQARVAYLVRKRRFRKQALVLAFEGMDAAGKGGAIRRVTHAFDARQYEVVPVSAPTQEERSYPYLWRFWRHIPELGHIAIFDRTWYGRVLVERVRGFTPEPDWRRAYDEISEFELQLTEHGILVAKFWLAVSKEEQLGRFKSRDTDPLKRFKVDKEDWTNRRFYDDYQSAAAEMIHRTDAPQAKWTVVPADDKKAARLMVLKTVCKTLEH